MDARTQDTPTTDATALPPGWSTVTLRGGPHAGQTMTVPTDQEEVVAFDDTKRHTYYRAPGGAVFLHEALLSGAFGGRG